MRLIRQQHSTKKKCCSCHGGVGRATIPSFLRIQLLQLLLCLLCGCSLIMMVQAETEIKWTPNEQDQQAAAAGTAGGGGTGAGAGPLPLSNQQRQQLLQLDQVIQTSANPQETLQQAAAANQMHPQDLLDILIRNRNDMAQSGGASGGMTAASGGRRPQNNILIQCLTSLLVMASRLARLHPQTFSISTLVVILLLYTWWTIPRTGFVLSSARGGLLFSHGPTTLYSPPTAFLRRILSSLQDDSDDEQSTIATTPVKAASNTMWKEMQDLLLSDDKDDKVNVNIVNRTVWHAVGKRTVAPSLQQAASCQVTMDMKDLILSSSKSSSSSSSKSSLLQKRKPSARVKEEEADEEEDEEEDHKDDAEHDETDEADEELAYLLDVAYDQAFRLVLEQHGPLTEFVQPPDSIRFVTLEKDGTTTSTSSSSTRRRHQRGLLVVSGMGDWKRYGIVPMQVTQQSENDETELRLTWSTLKEMSHWDGHLQIQVEKKKKNQQLVVRVLLLVPNKTAGGGGGGGRKIASRTLALQIVQGMAHSIASSIQQRTALTLARQSQSTRYRGSAHGRAEQRRARRSFKERQMEEMATDRRRRWQRSNPNSGHYRPSGTRMQSPNNAVYH